MNTKDREFYSSCNEREKVLFLISLSKGITLQNIVKKTIEVVNFVNSVTKNLDSSKKKIVNRVNKVNELTVKIKQYLFRLKQKNSITLQSNKYELTIIGLTEIKKKQEERKKLNNKLENAEKELKKAQKKQYDINKLHDEWSNFLITKNIQGTTLTLHWEELKENLDYEVIEELFNNPEEIFSLIKGIMLNTHDTDINIEIAGRIKKFCEPLKNLRGDEHKLLFIECEIDHKAGLSKARKLLRYSCERCTAESTQIIPDNELLKETFTLRKKCVKCDGRLSETHSETTDYQKILIRDLDIHLLPGEQPTQFNAVMKGALLQPKRERTYNVGDKIQLIGYQRSYYEKNNELQAKKYIEVVGMQHLNKESYDEGFTQQEKLTFNKIKNDDPLKIFTKNIFCNHQGDDTAKKLVTLQLFSGFHPTKRDSLHILLFGDPGTGKTKNFLFKIENFTPRNVLISSTNNTSAGLGISAAKNDFLGLHVAQLGGVPRAHNGFLLIDELNDIHKDLHSNIIESMENGFVTSNKTGAHGKYPAVVKVLATANPLNQDNCLVKGVSVFDQALGITGKFFDRFDFVIPFVDDSPFCFSHQTFTPPIRSYDDNILVKYMLFASRFDPVIPKNIISLFDKVFLAIGRRDVLRQSKYRVMRKCINLVKSVARLHCCSVVSESHVLLAADVYSEYWRVLDSINSVL